MSDWVSGLHLWSWHNDLSLPLRPITWAEKMVRRAYQVHLWNSHAQQDSVQTPRCDSQDCCLVLISAFLSPPLSFSHILPNSSCGQPPSSCPLGTFFLWGGFSGLVHVLQGDWVATCPPGELPAEFPGQGHYPPPTLQTEFHPNTTASVHATHLFC